MTALFDETMEQLLREQYVGLPVAGLIAELYERRGKSGQNEWRELVGNGLRRHPVYPLLLEDPFVRHSVERPRGYPGDAELLDYIYGRGNAESMVERASAIGKRLHEYDRSTPAPAAVRNRSRVAAAEIDRVAATGMRPHVLSIACGHLREADRLQALRADAIGRFVGLDQDSRSLEVVRREWQSHGVETSACDAQTLLRKGIAGLGRFDFIYSLGLYYYLSDAAARRLLATAVDMLNPGGKVWIAARRTFREPESNVGFLELTRAWCKLEEHRVDR